MKQEQLDDPVAVNGRILAVLSDENIGPFSDEVVRWDASHWAIKVGAPVRAVTQTPIWQALDSYVSSFELPFPILSGPQGEARTLNVVMVRMVTQDANETDRHEPWTATEWATHLPWSEQTILDSPIWKVLNQNRASLDKQMLNMLHADNFGFDSRGVHKWTAAQWAESLGCSEQAVTGTTIWTAIQDMEELERLEADVAVLECNAFMLEEFLVDCMEGPRGSLEVAAFPFRRQWVRILPRGRSIAFYLSVEKTPIWRALEMERNRTRSGSQQENEPAAVCGNGEEAPKSLSVEEADKVARRLKQRYGTRFTHGTKVEWAAGIERASGKLCSASTAWRTPLWKEEKQGPAGIRTQTPKATELSPAVLGTQADERATDPLEALVAKEEEAEAEKAVKGCPGLGDAEKDAILAKLRDGEMTAEQARRTAELPSVSIMGETPAALVLQQRARRKWKDGESKDVENGRVGGGRN